MEIFVKGFHGLKFHYDIEYRLSMHKTDEICLFQQSAFLQVCMQLKYVDGLLVIFHGLYLITTLSLIQCISNVISSGIF